MRYEELITELRQIGGRTLEDEYKNWILRVSKNKMPSGKFKGAAWMKKKPEYRFEMIGISTDEVFELLKQEIDSRINALQQNFNNVTSVTIDLNADFTRDIISEIGEVTAAKFTKDGSVTYLDILDPEWYEELGATGGFKKITSRLSSKSGEDATNMYAFPISIKAVQDLGLSANGRYTVEQEPKKPGDPVWRYSINLHSVALSSAERVKLPGPGFNVAVTR